MCVCILGANVCRHMGVGVFVLRICTWRPEFSTECLPQSSFWRQDLSLNVRFSVSASLAASERQASVFLCLSNAGILEAHCHAQLLHGS